MNKYIFDTNVFIDHLKNNHPQAGSWIKRVVVGEITGTISVMTELEMWVGVNSEDDARETKIALIYFQRLGINSQIAIRASELLKPYKNDKGQYYRMMPDALIAATAEKHGCSIVTANKKHFENLPLGNIRIYSYPEK